MGEGPRSLGGGSREWNVWLDSQRADEQDGQQEQAIGSQDCSPEGPHARRPPARHSLTRGHGCRVRKAIPPSRWCLQSTLCGRHRPRKRPHPMGAASLPDWRLAGARLPLCDRTPSGRGVPRRADGRPPAHPVSAHCRARRRRRDRGARRRDPAPGHCRDSCRGLLRHAERMVSKNPPASSSQWP